MRRGKDDTKWAEAKKRVTKRDKGLCRFIKTLTMQEMMMLKKLAPRILLERVDHAHIKPVSLYPFIMYDDNNIVCLNRYSHHNLDNCCHPITGKEITEEERDNFWIRIIGEKTFSYLQQQIQRRTENGKSTRNE